MCNYLNIIEIMVLQTWTEIGIFILKISNFSEKMTIFKAMGNLHMDGQTRSDPLCAFSTLPHVPVIRLRVDIFQYYVVSCVANMYRPWHIYFFILFNLHEWKKVKYIHSIHRKNK